MNKFASSVLCCDIEGDQEGRTNKHLGYFQGTIEDILRLTAPKATHAEARFGADYEMSVDYYKSAEDLYKYFSAQLGISEKERHPNITLVETQSSIGSKMAVRVDVDKVTQFIGRLLPQTQWQRLNYASGKPSNTLLIDL